MRFITIGERTINTSYIWYIEIDTHYNRKQQDITLQANDGSYSFTIWFEHMDPIVVRYPTEAEMFNAHGQLLDVLVAHRVA